MARWRVRTDPARGEGIGAIEVAGAVVVAALIVAGFVWVGRRAADEDAEAVTTGRATPIALWSGYRSATYADGRRWVCRPYRHDVCDGDLDTTVIQPDGSTTVEPFRPDPKAPVDCFYLYPTVSRDPGVNSDLDPADDQEGAAALLQAARFGRTCRVFAPVYRQRTLTDLVGGVEEGTPGVAGGRPAYDVAYDDVVDAFRQYIANDNQGRGFVLIGQAQGSTHLATLLQREIAPNPELRSHLVSALLIGASITIDPADPDAVPACRRPGQVGCIVSYASYRATAPPGPDAKYGRSHVCTNPAALGGGSAVLHSYFPKDRHVPFVAALSKAGPPWLAGGDGAITTPFVATPGLVSGECVQRGGAAYLQVTVHGDPADPRTDDITGDLVPSWGLHMVDIDLAMGDLVDVVTRQRDAYLAAG